MDIFITSLTRSGSSLLSNILNNHSKIYVAQDFLFNCYKLFYQKYYKTNHIKSCYFNKRFIKLSNELNKKKFSDYNLSKKEKNFLISKIKKRSKNLLFNKLIDRIVEKNFEKFLKKIFKVLKETTNKQLICTKEAWCSELIPQLIKTFPRLKIIYVFRDPRGVISSESEFTRKYRVNKKDPLFTTYSLSNFWRKHVFFHFKFSNNKKYQNRILGVRYEDLVQKTDFELKKIFKFLKLDYETKTKKISFNNSNYGSSNKAIISREYVNMWKKKLSKSKSTFIETILYPELRKVGYDTQLKKTNILKVIKKNKEFRNLNKIYSKKELDRLNYYVNLKNFNKDVLKLLFLSEKFAKNMKVNLR